MSQEVYSLSHLTSIDLPVAKQLSKILNSLSRNPNLILQAEPGAGKTTLVPLAVLNLLQSQQKILLLEPRRLAAVNAAQRMSEILGEKLGQTVGYRIRNQTQVSANTRIEVITEGILTRMLQQDPELTGVGCVIFDEFHERSIDLDLGLALTLEAQSSLRPELKLLVMSATLDALPLQNVMPQANLINCEGRSYSVSIQHIAPKKINDWRSVLLTTVNQALLKCQKNILIFLPGIKEISIAEELLTSLLTDKTIEIKRLYGSMPFDQQRMVFNQNGQSQREIILATNIAETSLTLPHIDGIIDCGLNRISRFDPVRGISRLMTQRVSQASAKQRAGRAGRTGEGYCWRLWQPEERLRAHDDAEIVRADLTSFALEIAQWGVTDVSKLSLLESPNPVHLEQARRLLINFSAVDQHYRALHYGKLLLSFGTHPRIAQLILKAVSLSRDLDNRATKNDWIATACLIAAMLEEKDLLAHSNNHELDFDARLHAMQNTNFRSHTKTLIEKQYQRLINRTIKLGMLDQYRDYHAIDTRCAAVLLAAAYPDRIAQVRGQSFRLANGTGADWAHQQHGIKIDPKNQLLIAVELAEVANSTKIFQAILLEKSIFETLFQDKLTVEEQVLWDERVQMVTAKKRTMFDAICVSESTIEQLDDALVLQGLCIGIRQKGIANLNWNETTLNWHTKLMMLAGLSKFKDFFPDRSFTWLETNLETWLAPFLAGIRKLSDIKPALLDEALKSGLSWTQLQQLETLAPERIRVASGSYHKIDYRHGEKPILAVKLQEMFGEQLTPTIAEGEISVILHLLSPAGRPLQITEDLPSFWQNGYQEVKKEMKGRYPKHPWPDDPLTAIATAKTKRNM